MSKCEEEKGSGILQSLIDPENPLNYQLWLELDLMIGRMGRALVEQSDEHLEDIYDVLDIACGPGGWVQDVARLYPEMEVVGIDQSSTLIRYAGGNAARLGLENAQFDVMDVTQPLTFPDASFDLINVNLLSHVLLPGAWPSVFAECQRLLRPGGIVRLTEGTWSVGRFAPALTRLLALHQEVRSLGSDQTTPTMLLPLVREASFEESQCRACALDHSFGTTAYPGFLAYSRCLLRLDQPVLLQASLVSQQEWEALYQQSSREMSAEQFSAVLSLLTVWAKKPGGKAQVRASSTVAV